MPAEACLLSLANDGAQWLCAVRQQNRQQNTLTERNATELTREQNVLECGETGLYRTQWNGMERSAAVL
jgi:hypothetical protein